METGPLSPPAQDGPSPMLERAVLWLIPPATRESVAGDLWEIYRGPGAYLADALKAAPFVVLSQIRRKADPPLLALKAMLLFVLLQAVLAPDWALAVALGAVWVSLVAEAYHGGKRRPVAWAMLDILLAALAAEVLSLHMAHALKPDLQQQPFFMFFGSSMVPLLGVVRTATIIWSDGRRGRLADDLSLAELRLRYGAFCAGAARRNRMEILSLVALSVGLAIWPSQGRMAIAIVLAMAVALYLLLDGAAAPVPVDADFRGLRASFQGELARQHRLRCLVWWLWALPLFLAAFQEGSPLTVLTHVALGMIAGFFVESLNRERRDRAAEDIGRLDRAMERSS